jgi:hypothetical protein
MSKALKHLASDGSTQITGKGWPKAVAGQTQMAEKFALENAGSEALATMTGEIVRVGASLGNLQFRWALDTASPTLSKPYGMTGVLSAAGAGGVWGSVGQRGWRVSAVNAVGETAGSEKIVLNLVATTQKATIGWTQVAGATGYRVYRTDTPDVFGTTALRAVIGNGAVVTYLDDGGATSAGAVPEVNTSGGWLLGLSLSAPAAGGVWSAPITVFYRVAARDATGIILASTLEASIAVDDVTKKVTVTWPSVPSAATYSVYRTTETGVYLAKLRATVSIASFVDDGGAVGAGDLTVGPSYGFPPAPGSFTAGHIVLGNFDPVQQAFYWCNRVVPSSAPGDDQVSGRHFFEA